MRARFLRRILIVAAVFAFVGDIGSVAGGLALLSLSAIALIWIARHGYHEQSRTAQVQFAYWLISTLAFGSFVVLFAPLAQLEATVIALVMLSPLFGLLVYVVATASFMSGDGSRSAQN